MSDAEDTSFSAGTPTDVLEAAVARIVSQTMAELRWPWAVFCYETYGAGSTSALYYKTLGGQVLRDNLHSTVFPLMEELRQETTDQARGAWLSAVVVLRADGSEPVFRYSYDERPASSWGPESREALLQELQRHPRSPEHVPAWWRRLEDPAEDATGRWDEVLVIPEVPDIAVREAMRFTDDPELLRQHAANAWAKVRFEIACNKACPSDVLGLLADDEDKEVRTRVGRHRSTPPESLVKLARSGSWSMVGNPAAPVEAYFILAQDPDEDARRELARGFLPPEVLASMVHDPSPHVRRMVATHPDLTDEAAAVLAQDPEERVREYLASARAVPEAPAPAPAPAATAVTKVEKPRPPEISTAAAVPAATLELLGDLVPMHAGTAYTTDQSVPTAIEPVGFLRINSGSLGIGDVQTGDVDFLLRVSVAPGNYPVYATTWLHRFADGHERTFTAAATILLSESLPASREKLRDAQAWVGEKRPDDEPNGVPIDGGACAFVDTADLEAALTPLSTWEHFCYEYLASTDLPWVEDLPGGGDLVAVQSGMGDGTYNVFGDYDPEGNLVAVHVDFAMLRRTFSGDPAKLVNGTTSPSTSS